MANLNPDQFNRPGTGYAPDPKRPAPGQTKFQCQGCGSQYIVPTKLDPEVTRMSNCRNLGCGGPVVRT
jgi:hypothetical protein